MLRAAKGLPDPLTNDVAEITAAARSPLLTPSDTYHLGNDEQGRRDGLDEARRDQGCGWLAHTALAGLTLGAGVQLFALLTPPVLIATSVYRRSFRLSPFLRNTAVGTFLGGGAFGAGLGWAKTMSMDPVGLEDRAYRLKMNVGQRRVDDYSTIGAVLGAVSPGGDRRGTELIRECRLSRQRCSSSELPYRIW